MKKRGQFFLLAAVIISVIVISIGVTTNRAVVQNEPTSFYDFTYEVEREVGEAFNYDVYTNINGGKVGEFVFYLSEEMRDDDPESDFVFVFGDDKNLTLNNYGSESIEIITGDIEDFSDESTVYFGRKEGFFPELTTQDNCYTYDYCYVCPNGEFEATSCYLSYEIEGASENADGLVCSSFGCSPITGTLGDYDSDAGTVQLTEDLLAGGSVSIVIGGSRIAIPVTPYAQVYFIAKKDSGNESFITVN